MIASKKFFLFLEKTKWAHQLSQQVENEETFLAAIMVV